MKSTEVMDLKHRGFILFCECAVKPDGLHVGSLGYRPCRPHGPLPILDFYTYTHNPWFKQRVHSLLISHYPRLWVFSKHYTMPYWLLMSLYGIFFNLYPLLSPLLLYYTHANMLNLIFPIYIEAWNE